MKSKNHSTLFRFFVILMALTTVFNNSPAVFAQNGSGASESEVLDLLSQGADNSKSLGSFLWNQTHEYYSNIGDLAAGELTDFLAADINKDITLNGEPAEISIKGKGELSEKYNSVAEFSIQLKNGDIIETGTLKLDQEAAKDYVNQELYPKMKKQLTGPVSESVPLVKDVVSLLTGSAVSGQKLLPNKSEIWTKLAESMSDYPEIEKLLRTPSKDPLLTVTVDNITGAIEDDPNSSLEKIFSNEGSTSEESSAILSASSLITALNKIEAIPDGQISLDTDPETPAPDVRPTGQSMDIFKLFTEKELPSTGFSASHITPLKIRPDGLSYEMTGFTLQIPELDIAENIVSVPLTDSEYPVEWIGINVGMLEGSSMPGQGITVLTGHNHLNTTEAGPFLFISTLSEGDRLFITDADQSLQSFKVYGNYRVSADDFESLSDNLKENSLILITCEDESVDGGYINRRIIFAERM